MNLRPAKLTDLASILALETDDWPENYGQSWNLSAWSEELGEKNRVVFVAEIKQDDGQRLVGVASFLKGVDEAELMRILVSSTNRRQGVATQLLKAGFEWAKKQELMRLILEVSQQNLGAQNFYRALGFEVIGQRRDYYGHGVNAVMMAKTVEEK